MDNDSARNQMTRPVIGLIALNRDTVIEEDMHHLLASQATLATTRIHLERIGSVGALRDLERYLAPASALLPVSAGGVVAVGCTSAVTVIGSETIKRRVREGRPDAVVVNPLEAICLGLTAVGARRIALVSPYNDVISRRVVAWLEQREFIVGPEIKVADQHSRYADIPVTSITEAAAQVGFGVDAVVIPCTDLRAVSVINQVESEIGVPVITSNQALVWSISRTLDELLSGPGVLFNTFA
jgi:maleate isomerase